MAAVSCCMVGYTWLLRIIRVGASKGCLCSGPQVRIINTIQEEQQVCQTSDAPQQIGLCGRSFERALVLWALCPETVSATAFRGLPRCEVGRRVGPAEARRVRDIWA